jgi:hypothetical protein
MPSMDNMREEARIMMDLRKVSHRGKIQDVINTLVRFKKIYVIGLKKIDPKKPWLYEVIDGVKPKVNAIIAFTDRNLLEGYRKKLSDGDKWEVVDFDAKTAVDTIAASHRHFLTQEGVRYYVKGVWVNPLAGGANWEKKIPISDIEKDKDFFVKALSKYSKIYFLYRKKILNNDDPEPLMGFDPEVQGTSNLVIPVYVHEDLAKYYWSRLGDKTKALEVKAISVSEFLDEIHKMRNYFRIDKQGTKEIKIPLRGIWFNPRHDQLEYRFSKDIFVAIWEILKKNSK